MRVYRRFALRHPRWAASLFDEHFLRVHAAALLGQHSGRSLPVVPTDLAAAWLGQFSLRGSIHVEHLDELVNVATDFLHMLNAELGLPSNDVRSEVEPGSASHRFGSL